MTLLTMDGNDNLKAGAVVSGPTPLRKIGMALGPILSSLV